MLRKLIVIGLLAASFTFAQGKKGGGDKAGGDSGSPMPMALPSKLDQISSALNLTKDQKKTVKAMLEDAAKEATPLRDQISKTRIAVSDVIQAKKSQDDIIQASAAAATVETQLESLQMKTFAKIFTTLDENQKSNKQGVQMTFALMNGIFRNKNWNEN